MARSVGVELTDSSVKLLWLEQGGKKSRILQFHEAPIPAEGDAPWEERASAALREAFARSKIPRTQVLASIDSGDAILREISLPFKGEEQIRRTVRFEMESQIHNYTIEQLVVAHYKTGETEKGSLLLGAAVPKAAIARRLKVFQDAGADPAAVDLDVCAVFNAMLHAGAIDPEAPHLLVYGTSKFTKLILVERKTPRSIRTIRFSLPAPEAAPAAPGGPAEPFPKLALEAQRSLVEILAKEVSRFLLASAASATPAHILLTGAFEDPQAASMLESATRIPVRTFNLLDAVEHSFPEAGRGISSRMGVPLGLALKGAGIDALGMDFRQEEFSYRKKFEAVKTTALVAAELVVVLLAAVALLFYFRRDEARAAGASVLDAQRQLYEEASGEKLADPSAAFPKLQEILRRYEGPLGKEAPLKTSARELWIQLYRALESYRIKYGPQTLGEGSLKVQLEGLDIRQTTTPGNESTEMILRGKIRNLEFAGKLKEILAEVPIYQSAEYNAPITPIPGEDLCQFSLRAYSGKKGN